MDKLRVLITGTEGFIGNNLKESIKNDYIIYEINEDLFHNESWFNSLKNQLVQINPHIIFHIGACSDTLETDVNYMMSLNFESTKILTDFSKQKSIPLIYSSSAANYGVNFNNPSNLYGWSKYVAEQYVISNGGIALRYFNVYGHDESKKGRMSSTIYQFYQKNIKKEKIELFPLKPTRDFIYVKDIISANLFALENYQKLNGNWYDVGYGESRPFEDILTIMDYNYSYTDEDKIPIGYQFYTCSKKEKWMDGWYPKFNLEEGIKDYLSILNINYC
jgi:ADP-L-glycero-D-manno-heptose 6-epimerase